MSFGQKLNEVLLEHEMTPADLSRQLGWNTGVISQYMNKPDRSPKLSTAVKIADALGVSIDWLAGREGFDMHGRIDRSTGALQKDERKLVGDYRSTHDYFKPEISAYAEDMAERHPKNEALGGSRAAAGRRA